MNTKKLLSSLILASSGLLAASSYAAIIPAWDWATDGGFITGESTCNNGPTEASCNITYLNAAPAVTPSGIPGTASVMTWGTPFPGFTQKSGLQGVFGSTGDGAYDAALLGSGPVNIPMFEQLITNGDWTNTGAAVHYNNVINAGSYMTSAKLLTTFQLVAPPIGGPELAQINIGFLETTNTAPCAGDNPHGTVCDDIFTITALPPPINFVHDGYIYTISFRFAEGPGSIVSGDGTTIWTAEDAPGTAIMFTQAQILARAVPVPVPGALALMGMGLMLLGWRVRDRKVT